MKFTAVALSALALAGASDAAPFGIFNNFDQIAVNVKGLIHSQSPFVGKPLVDTESLQSFILEENLRSQADNLFAIAGKSASKFGHPTRVIGSGGHYATLGYIESSLRSFGGYYNITKQHFKAPVSQIFSSTVNVNGSIVEEAKPFALTPPTHKRKPVYGNLVLVKSSGCDAEDYPAELNGQIALIERGVCSFGDKSFLAGQAGAVAAIIYNNVPAEGVISGTLGAINKTQVATVGVSNEAGSVWVDALKAGENLTSSVYVDSYVKNAGTYNIIAETVTGDPDNIVMLGAHSDSVTAGPGINDDGSGTISLLEVAAALTNFTVTNKVRFAWWAAEEEGLLGSDYYVEQLTPGENQKIRVFMDYDMMASPNFALQVYDANNEANPNGSGELKNLYIDYYNDHGFNHTLIPFDGRSDYDAFIKHGIPGGGIATGAEVLKTEKEAEMFGGQAGIAFDPCYHQLCDNLYNVDYPTWILNTKLIAHSVATYARTFDGFPERNVAAKVKSVQYMYHGDKLII